MDYLIYSGTDIRGRENIEFGENSVIQRDVWLDIRKGAKLIIGKGANIGRRCVIGCGKRVEIGEKVLLGPNVYVNDMDHAYQDITKSIMEQGITNPRPIKIGYGSWCGINSVIRANVGKGCVVGANSVVTHDVPDFCMVAGQPAIIRKRYNLKTKKWKSVNWMTRTGLSRIITKFFHRLSH